jgi:4-amino-4-deoxy-L-arabinose transferase-like glycosyltransferase
MAKSKAKNPANSKAQMLDKIKQWIALHPNWTLTLVTLAALIPFLAKPFNIDDPLFIWTAHQIRAHPDNPYGFDVNWYESSQHMWQLTKNPPLTCYYLALAAAVLGWSEVALHFSLLLPALAVILGTHRLAQKFCRQPILAALTTLFTPVFLIASATIMCDVMMLAFWVWAVVFWIEGMEKINFRTLSAAGLLIALAALTKYFGACLIPLLLTYGVISQRRLGWWAAGMLIPLAVLAVYQVETKIHFGYGLLSDVGTYAIGYRKTHGFSQVANVLTTLTFTGGCLVTPLFFAPLLWRKRTLLTLIASGILISGSILIMGNILKKYELIDQSNRHLVEIQIVFWAIGGICALALVVGEMLVRRDARSWLLTMWVLGTFMFVAFFNWTVNGRSILPMAPATGILIVRCLEQNTLKKWKIRPVNVAFCLGLSGLLALLTAQADFRQAVAVRQCAQQVCARYGTGRETLWFEGHWGFQYYMDKLGALPVAFEHSCAKPGDYVALPANNSNTHPIESQYVSEQMIIVAPSPLILTTMNSAAGSAFYASVLGPLPYSFGSAYSENVSIFRLKFPAN